MKMLHSKQTKGMKWQRFILVLMSILILTFVGVASEDSDERGRCGGEILLAHGEGLEEGVSKRSSKCKIKMKKDGNLMLWQRPQDDSDIPIHMRTPKILRWVSGEDESRMNTKMNPKYYAKMQRDGNFLIGDLTRDTYHFKTSTEKYHSDGDTYTLEAGQNCLPFVCKCPSSGQSCYIIW